MHLSVFFNFSTPIFYTYFDERCKRISRSGAIHFYCIVLYCIVLYCIVLYCIVLYCIVLYCIVLYCGRLSQIKKLNKHIQYTHND